MIGKVVGIFIASEAGEPMRAVKKVMAIRGLGLEGDRYAGERGVFSKSGRKVVRHVSLIEQEAIDRVKQEHGIEFPAKVTRRNIVTKGISLNSLVGVEFFIWGVKMRGVELGDPCKRPSKLWEKEETETKPNFKELFDGFGGLRAKVLTSGLIYLGADISTTIYKCLLCGTTTSHPHVCPEFYPELR